MFNQHVLGFYVFFNSKIMAAKEEKKQRKTIFLKHSTSDGVGAVFIGEASLRQLGWEDIALCWTTGCISPLCRYKTLLAQRKIKRFREKGLKCIEHRLYAKACVSWLYRLSSRLNQELITVSLFTFETQ